MKYIISENKLNNLIELKPELLYFGLDEITKNTDKIYKLIRDKNFAKFWSLHEKKKPIGFYPDSLKRLISSFFSAEVDRRPTLDSLKDDEWMNAQAVADIQASLRPISMHGTRRLKACYRQPDPIRLLPSPML